MNPRLIVVAHRRSRRRVSFRKSDEEFKNESRWSFIIELLVFGLLVAISAWPIVETAEALRAL